MAANPKHAQSRKGRHQLSRKGRTSGRRSKEEMKEARIGAAESYGNGNSSHSEELEQPEMAAERFAREAGEQISKASEKAWSRLTPQVLGWSATAPAEQLEKMMQQFWSFGSNGEANRYARALAQTNVEMIGLVGRRSRAYLDLPNHIAECRTPQQILEQQARFFQEMLNDYQTTNERVMNCWMEATSPPSR